MSLDHLAIRKAYPNAVVIDDGEGAFDSSGNQIVLQQSKIDTARTELNTAYAKVKYKDDRAILYPTWQEQMDMQYWDKKNGTTTWVDAIDKIKSDHPKPS